MNLSTKIEVCLGLDPALFNSGVCEVSRTSIAPKSITTDREDSDLVRQIYAVTEIASHFSHNKLIAIEDFGHSAKRSQNSGKSIERIEMVGMLRMKMYQDRFPVIQVIPQHLKAFIAGKSTASKEQVKEAVRTVWRVPVKNGDEADATALALIAAGILGWLPDLNKKQLGVLEKVRGYRENASVLQGICS